MRIIKCLIILITTSVIILALTLEPSQPITSPEGTSSPREADFPFLPALLNKGARVPILVWQTEEALSAHAGLGFPIKGLTILHKDGSVEIHILGPWNENSAVLVHEWCHYLEAKMPDQAQRIRDCFHDLCSPSFDIATNDLEAPIVPRTKTSDD